MFRLSIILNALLSLLALTTHPTQASQQPLSDSEDLLTTAAFPNITLPLFFELEELSRIVDISYCVGTTGIQAPFKCASRCADFPSYELVSTFNTGPLMSDSCGYIVLDHSKKRLHRDVPGRILVAFRGTYSIANTIVDLSTVPQEYIPYPDDPANGTATRAETRAGKPARPECRNCTVHSGFWTSWQNTRPLILPHLESLHATYPDYEISLVGHSLGGAVAALAGLEFQGLGWGPIVTTFGEPRIGNSALRDWVDGVFKLPHRVDLAEGREEDGKESRYRRITHVDDPIPLLPLQEWGYRPHAGEIYISKKSLQPTIDDLRFCSGDEDVNCIAGAEVDEAWFDAVENMPDNVSDLLAMQDEFSEEELGDDGEVNMELRKRWGIPARYKIWQLFFAHRDYFWRLGLCAPGGDPWDWGRGKYEFDDGEGEVDKGGN
jgi:hypothetical protein